MSIIVVYTTHKDKEEAERISTHLMDLKLVACSNIFPIDSHYVWNNVLQNDEEMVALFKSRPEHWQKIQDEIKKMHSYDIPCIIKYDVEANPEYEDWVYAETES